MPAWSRFSFPTRIVHGAGARAAVAEWADAQGVARPLVVTDPGLLPTSAFALTLDVVRERWDGSHAVFSGVHPNPVEADVEQAATAYTAAGCDGVIGLGGGSALDVAKAVRLLIAFPGKLGDVPMDALPPVLAPFCAIPTSAGTGSEVGRSSVITMAATGRKTLFFGPPLMANLAILDPELTVDLPPHLTAATGMDALTHAIESFVCPVYHPMCDGIALEAVRLVRMYLPRAVSDGHDLKARGQMLMAATMGAVAFQKDLGAAHSLSHPLSTEFGLHHGLANALALPPVVRFNGESDSGQYERVAVALGLTPGPDPAAQVADLLAGFNARIGITKGLGDLGVPREALPKLARLAFEDVCHQTNPRPCSEADFLRLYGEMW
ncbi:MAG: iron-containing alcohol dehydrogenase [Armatimonadetes bacterium]|nr:iron-containing alcohol dehydrogenase [Armatimonadota bacterium]